MENYGKGENYDKNNLLKLLIPVTQDTIQSHFDEMPETLL